jgi:segregation and condensation protein A
MQSYLKLDQADFNGPLDLLLELVRKQKLDLETVDLVDLVDQYLRIVESEQLATHAQYASIAATLIAIKCRRLLPTDENEIDEEEQLREKLLLYQKYLALSVKLKDELQNKKLPVYKQENILSNYVQLSELENDGNSEDVLSALWLIIERNLTKKSFDHNIVEKEKLSPKLVNEKLEQFLKLNVTVDYIEFIQAHTREFVIYSFLHLLDLIKSNFVQIVNLQDNQILLKRIKYEQ